MGGRILGKVKVSIVVPAYNVENFIRPCLNSAANQTLKDIEIICVDDGSTDSTGAILDEYAAKDNRFKIIHKENGGYGVAMNTGLEAATGEYFAVLESDDFVKPDMYEVLYKAAKEFNAEVVRSNYYSLTTPNGEIHLEKKLIHETIENYYNRVICPNEEQVVYTFIMHNWTGIYSIDFLRKNGIKYNTTPGASYQDNGFFFQVFSQTKSLVYIPNHFYCYRMDNPGSSIHDPKKVYTMAKEFEFVKEKLDEKGLFDKVKYAYYIRLYRAYHETYQRIDDNLKPEFLKFYRKDLVMNDKLGNIDWNMFETYHVYAFRTLRRSAYLYSQVASTNKTLYQYVITLVCKTLNALKVL